STRCQAVLEAFRDRPPAARRMIESARRSLAELGLRHALLEVDLFAGIVELVAGEPADAERNLRRAYTGFRSMGVDVDAAQAAADRAASLYERKGAAALVERAKSLGVAGVRRLVIDNAEPEPAGERRWNTAVRAWNRVGRHAADGDWDAAAKLAATATTFED